MDLKQTNILQNKVQFRNAFPLYFYDKRIMNHISKFLNEISIKTLKNCLRKTGAKEQKKQIKELVKNYILDFGKHQEKVNYSITAKGSLFLSTNIFNAKAEFLSQFTHIIYNKEILFLEQEDLFKYLRVYPKNEVLLSDNQSSLIKLAKPLIPYDAIEDDKDEEEENNSKKYEMYYKEENINQLKDMDFSNRDLIIERQKQILEKMSIKEKVVFYPLQFINTVKYWTIILCEGGYFACGFFLKDQLVDHKSDHKYVVRKQAGQRQIYKDKSKKIKSSIGAQIRRANEKKHQENIEYILKINEEYLVKSDCIFIQAPGFNKNILIGDDRPLSSYKKKILNIPFTISRANYSNVMEVYKKLITVSFEINDDRVRKMFK